ncbi:ATP-binding protein [Kitasatospora herbaricolor]|uniref:ATP-binding protein n=1 Tax=Kitasatospora herbaricolor TaxID=68217 RepID=A0ABZ1W8J7_9ACTN|nr:ATP-binding protein [Kitasatospora herbaricolor]
MTGPTTPRHQPHPHLGGRAEALRALAAWHAGGPAEPKLLLLTGDPGSGRSRLVGGFLMLCDPVFRRRIDLTVLDPATVPSAAGPGPLVFGAAGLTPDQLLLRLADVLAPGARLTAEVYEQLAALDEEHPVTIVVPDVDRVGVLRVRDEALRATRAVLSPLAQSPGVRLLADLPRAQAHWLADQLPPEQVLVIDLDEAPWADPPGLALQAAHTLGGGLPFAPSAQEAGRLAADLARTAGNALVVRLAASSLRVTPGGGPPKLPGTVGEALDLHAERCGTHELTLRRLLTPLALAREGAVLPLPLWARLASAVAGRDLSRTLLEGQTLLAPFFELVEPGQPGRTEPDDGQPAVRLVHPAVGAELRERLGTTALEAHRRITGVLLEDVPAGGPERWARVTPYVREQLTAHALEAGRLPELLADPGFLVHTPQVLLRAAVEHLTRTGADLPPVALTWLRLAPQFTRTELHPAQRAGLLEYACHQDGLPGLDFGPGLPWRTLWWHPLPEITAVTAAYGPGGAPAVVAALPTAEGSTLVGFDAATGTPIPQAERLARPGEEQRAAARFALSSGADHVRVWGGSAQEPVTSLALPAGSLVAADITPDGILLLADPFGLAALRVTAPGA